MFVLSRRTESALIRIVSALCIDVESPIPEAGARSFVAGFMQAPSAMVSPNRSTLRVIMTSSAIW
jgi:hypothetical protein